MTRYLYANGVRIFDYPQFAMELRDRVRDGAASLAAEAGITIEHITKSHIRKEAIVARVLEQRGEHPGPVHIISAMEACDSYRPWHDKGTGKTFVRPDSGKCLHYYFYFLDAAFGLIYRFCRIFPQCTSETREVRLAYSVSESLSGHIPRSSLRSSDLLPFYHQYPAACCGDFY